MDRFEIRGEVYEGKFIKAPEGTFFWCDDVFEPVFPSFLFITDCFDVFPFLYDVRNLFYEKDVWLRNEVKQSEIRTYTKHWMEKKEMIDETPYSDLSKNIKYITAYFKAHKTPIIEV